MIQAARGVEPAALMQVDPGEGAGRQDIPAGVEDRRLAERVIDVAFDDVARIVKERGDIIVAVLGDVQALVQCPITVAVPVPQHQGIVIDWSPLLSRSRWTNAATYTGDLMYCTGVYFPTHFQ